MGYLRDGAKEGGSDSQAFLCVDAWIQDLMVLVQWLLAMDSPDRCIKRPISLEEIAMTKPPRMQIWMISERYWEPTLGPSKCWICTTCSWCRPGTQRIADRVRWGW